MSIDQKHLKLVASGGYTDSDFATESWACGINLFADQSIPDDEGDLPTTGSYSAASDSDASDGLHITADWKWEVLGGPVVNPVQYLHDQAAGAWADFISAVVVSSKVTLNELRLYPMQGDGNAFESRVAVCTYDTPVPGGRSGDMLPPQVSVVVSWRTARPGPKGRGRIYTPASTVSGVASDGLVLGTMQGDLADAAQTLLEDLSFAGVGPTSTHIYPIVTGHPWTQFARILRLDVGNVADTQRRRRRQLVETRTSRTPSYP
jgi:hypothetical protein